METKNSPTTQEVQSVLGAQCWKQRAKIKCILFFDIPIPRDPMMLYLYVCNYLFCCSILKKILYMALVCPCRCCLVTKSCLTLYSPMDCGTPGSSAIHYRPEFAQTDARWVSDATQPSHPLSPPSPPAFSLFQHQGLFQSLLFASSSQSIRASPSALVLQLQHQSALKQQRLMHNQNNAFIPNKQ